MSQAQYQEFGPYRLTHLLGRGGMASVYRALKSGPMGFAKEVAIKRLHDTLTDNDQILKSLINEARLGGQLRHPNIVEIYEFDRIGESYYLAMEFVDGWTLDKVIKVSNEFEEAIPGEVVLDILLQILEGLHYAHTLESLDGQEVKLVHRDLKPANIILSRHGVAKLMDFGIAKADTNLFKTTMADVTKGTPHYMSPEQVAGEPNLGPASDIFAMGSVIYELVTGKILFRGDNLSTVLFAVVKAEVAKQLDEIEARVPGLGDIVGRCLRQNRDERYQDVLSLSRDLRALRASLGAGTSIRDYLYRLRTRVVAGAEAISEANTVHEHVPEFATLLGGSKKTGTSGGPSSDLLRALQADEVARKTGSMGAPSSSSLRSVSVGQAPAADQTQIGRPPPPRQRAGPNRAVVPAFVALMAVLVVLVGWTFFRPEPSGSNEGRAGPDPRSDPATPADTLSLGTPPADQAVATATPTAPVPFATPSRPAAASGSGWPTAKPSDAQPSKRPTPAASAEAPPAASIAPPPPPSTAQAAPAVATEPTSAPPAVVERASGTGFLIVKPSNPWSHIWIDGRNTGEKTPLRKLPLTAGTHVIRLVSSTMSGQVEKTVDIQGDKTTVLGKYDFVTETWSE